VAATSTAAIAAQRLMAATTSSAVLAAAATAVAMKRAVLLTRYSVSNLEVAERKECSIKRQSTCGEGKQSNLQSYRCRVDVCGKFAAAWATDEIKFYKKRPTINQ